MAWLKSLDSKSSKLVIYQGYTWACASGTISLHTYETVLTLYEKMLIIDHTSIPEIQQSWTQP